MEKIGLVNRFASTVSRLRELFERCKQFNRRVYDAFEHALMAMLAHALMRSSVD